jgi:excisionase family DNA binding protein
MPVLIEGQVYYRTLEACRRTGISRATLFRWLKAGILSRSVKDRRGWRLYTEDDVETIKKEADRIEFN